MSIFIYLRNCLINFLITKTMKLYTSTFLLAFAFFFCTSGLMAQNTNCGIALGSAPEITAATTSGTNGGIITVTADPCPGGLPTQEYVISVPHPMAGMPGQPVDSIVGTTTSNVITLADYNLANGDDYFITPVCYDVTQPQTLIQAIYDNNAFIVLACCDLASDPELGIDGLCPNLMAAGINSGTDITDLEVVFQVLAQFGATPVNVDSFVVAIEAVNSGVSALPASCLSGSTLPICYATGSLFPSTAILPVSLMAFDATAKGTYNEVSWVTEYAENVDYFVVESAENAIDFKDVGMVGYSEVENSYKFKDTRAFDNIVYYRLKTVDYDGSISYSKIVSLTGKGNTVHVTNILPNPVQNEMIVEFLGKSGDNITFSIMNTVGQVVSTRIVEATDGKNVLTHDMSSLVNGIYMLVAQNNDEREVIKFVKK